MTWYDPWCRRTSVAKQGLLQNFHAIWARNPSSPANIIESPSQGWLSGTACHPPPSHCLHGGGITILEPTQYNNRKTLRIKCTLDLGSSPADLADRDI